VASAALPFATTPPAKAVNPLLVTCVVMLASFITVLDSTIAYVALPHMAASLGAASDTVTWVLTSYIVAAAIATPLTAWLGGKVGRKRLFVLAIGGFVGASMLCGLAQSLDQMVFFRLLQGASGAFLIPLGQSFILDAYPREKHGQAMSLWGIGIMVGPVMGPVLGGWLTDNYDWRWVFYVNVPFGLLAMFGAIAVLPSPSALIRKFDAFGFVALGVGIGALQLMLDRGQQLDWFSSWEVRIEAAVCVMGLWVFGVHTLTARDSILPSALLRDRNIVTGFAFIFLIGMLQVATSALLPPMLEQLYGYPVVTAGLTMAPRGLGTMAGMLLVGRLIGRVDPRLLMMTGLTLVAATMWWMTGFSPTMGSAPFLSTGFVQGFGVGLVFVPLNTLAFATVAPALRTEAASFYSLLRNLGGSVGVSLSIGLLAHQTQVAHAEIGAAVTPFSVPGADPNLARALGATGDTVIALLDATVNGQAAMIAYLDDFTLMMWLSIAAVPLVLMLRAPKKIVVDPAHAAME
jgi:DHA2 family multidrug resistance protein